MQTEKRRAEKRRARSSLINQISKNRGEKLGEILVSSCLTLLTLTASCGLQFGAHALRQQLGLLHAADAVIGRFCFTHIAAEVPKDRPEDLVCTTLRLRPIEIRTYDEDKAFDY